MEYVFLKSINADTPSGSNKPFKAGQVITENDIAAGCLEACLKRQIIAKVAEPKKESKPKK